MSDNKVAFDLWWEWAEKSLDSPLTIDAYIHDAVMALPPDERRDREKVTERFAMASDLVRCGQLEVRTCTAFRDDFVRRCPRGRHRRRAAAFCH
jgi:hypothetical protein